MVFPSGQPADPNPDPPPVGLPVAAVDTFDKKLHFLGDISLILAILKLLAFGYRIVRSLATLLGADDTPHAFGRRIAGMKQSIAIWDGLRAMPFLVLGAALIVIAMRLRRGDATALPLLRFWCFWSLGAVAISIGIQAFVTIPLTLKIESSALGMIPSILGFDAKGMASAFVVGATLFGAALGTLLRLIVPVVLYIWSARLQKEKLARALPPEPV